MIRYIYHISDIHIRMYSRHDEYRYVFERLYGFLMEQSPGVIVITGDILHNKIDLTPECCTLVYEFCKRLGEIFPTFIIAGNHDALLNNRDRMDSLSSIFLDRLPENVYYYRDSGVYCYQNLVFVVNSLLDDHEWISCDGVRSKETDRVIALFHGQVGNWVNQFGFRSETYEKEVTDFHGADMVLLGDIHKHQYMEPNMAYAGSLLSQNFTEIDDDHGVLVWDVYDASSCFHRIENPYAFKTVQYKDGGFFMDLQRFAIDQIRLPEFGSVRLILPSTADYEILHSLKKRFSGVRFQTVYGESVYETPGIERPDDLDDSRLIAEYISTRCKGDYDDIQNELCRYYTDYLSNKSEKTDYELLTLKFDNMFGYGESNLIDFEKFDSGIVGIFGKNSAGKSTLIDILSFMLFNKITRYTSGNSIPKEIIHSSEKKSFGEIKLRIGGEVLIISKKCTRTKTDKIKIEERLFRVNSDHQKIELTDEQRKRTDKLIHEKISTFDNFLFTNVLLQQKEKSFRELTQSQRKDFLFHLFHFDIFEKLKKEKEDLLKKNQIRVDVLLKQLSGNTFDGFYNDLETVKKKKEELGIAITRCDKDLDLHEAVKEELLSQIIVVHNQSNDNINELISANEKKKKDLAAKITRYNKLLGQYDISELQQKLNVDFIEEFAGDPEFYQRYAPNGTNRREDWEEEKNRFFGLLDSFDRIKSAWMDKESTAKKRLEVLYQSMSNVQGDPEKEHIFVKRRDSFRKALRSWEKIDIEAFHQLTEEYEKEDWEYIDEKIASIEAILQKCKIEESLLHCERENFRVDEKIEYNEECGSCMKNPHYKFKKQKSDKIVALEQKILTLRTMIPSDYQEWKERVSTLRKKGLQASRLYKEQRDEGIRLEKEKIWIQTQEALREKKRIKEEIAEIDRDLANDPDGNAYDTILKLIPLVTEYKQMDRLWQVGYVDPQSVRDMLEKVNEYSTVVMNLEKDLEETSSLLMELHVKRAEQEKNKKILMDNKKKQGELDECRRNIKALKDKRGGLVLQLDRIQSDLERINIEMEMHRRMDDEIKALLEENMRLKVFVQIIDRDGLPLFLLSKKLPMVEKDINEIISPFMEKPVVFKIQEKDVVFGSHDDGQISFFYGGMEAFIIDMALKISFGRFGRLPRSNFFIIDEGVSVLDQDRIAGIRTIFDFMLTFNEKIFVISHLPVIKDFVNHRIEIVKKDNKSHLSFY